MVNSVVAVPTVGKIKREDEKTRATLYEERKGNSQGLFSELLRQEVEEQQEASANCRVVTYGQDSRLHTFEYQKREYRY